MDATILPLIQQQNKLFVTGPYASGKSELALARIRWLLAQERVRGNQILVLTPQRSLGQSYYDALRRADIPPGPPVRITTVAGLARQAVTLYWPLVGPEAGFADPSREPTFLTLETSQYHMARFVQAAVSRGELDALRDNLRVDQARIVSQILDNLNKAALHGFTIDEAYQRLDLTVPVGDQRTGRLNALNAVRVISKQFRELCLAYSLVDYSLLMTLFRDQVLGNLWSRTHLFRTCRHLILDNGEEETALGHDLVRQWLPHVTSALVLADAEGGFRLFLGADPEGVPALAQACDQRIALPAPPTHPALSRLQHYVQRTLARPGERPPSVQAESPTDKSPAVASPDLEGQKAQTIPLDQVLHVEQTRFYPQMIAWVVDEIDRLVHQEGVKPGQIAVLAPLVSDALRFSLQTGLAERGIPLTSHRPSRPLQAEPAAQALLTLAALAHPAWQNRPQAEDVALALHQTIGGLDPVRAQVLRQAAYPNRQQTIDLLPFVAMKGAVQERITFVAGERYDRLREWLYAYRALDTVTPLDQFFARLFGEVLSQPGFGFHQSTDGARIANQLIDSARNFRWALQELPRDSGADPAQSATERDARPVDAQTIGGAYVKLIQSGAVGALYLPGWREEPEAVFLAPAYTFLMRNRTVSIQFWLDIGASGWWERLYQPLTHPYVLSQRWSAKELWTDLDEFRTRQLTLRRLLLGLVRRAEKEIYLGLSDYGESGFEQRGPLLTAINRILLQSAAF